MGAENSNQTDKPRFVGEKVELEKLCAKGKSSLRQKDLLNDGPYPVYGASGIIGTMSTYQNDAPYVCIVKDGAGVGRAMKCRARSSVLGTMQALIPGEGINCDYLLHLVRSLKLGEGFTGSTIPHIYFRDYGKRLVPVFPYEQQIAIASMLNGIEALVDQRKLMLRKCDSLVKSRFVEMFGALAPSVPIAEACSEFVDGDWIESKDQSESGIRLIQTGNIGNGVYLNKGNRSRYISEQTFHELKCKEVFGGDILISRLPDPVGRACIAPSGSERYIAAVDCSITRLNKEWDSTYFVYFTMTDEYGLQIKNYLTGTTRKRISRSNLGKIKIPAAPFELQQEFASFVSQVDKLRFAGNHEMNFRCERFTLS